MNLSNLIEEYIRQNIEGEEYLELKRSDIANKFNCVPSQINYVISTRFIPELGFYVESRRGGSGYIRISRLASSKSKYIFDIIDKIGYKMSQSVVDIYLNDFISYNILDKREAKLVKAAMSDKSLKKVDPSKKDYIRADIFKSIIMNMV
ncbi:MAG: CtsR family transcriptional regulator [Clostridia bacterium]